MHRRHCVDGRHCLTALHQFSCTNKIQCKLNLVHCCCSSFNNHALPPPATVLYRTESMCWCHQYTTVPSYDSIVQYCTILCLGIRFQSLLSHSVRTNNLHILCCRIYYRLSHCRRKPTAHTSLVTHALIHSSPSNNYLLLYR